MTARARGKITAFFWAFVLSGLTAGAAEICLKPQAQVGGAIVLLGDVAEIRADDPAQREALRRLELFPAPAAGAARKLRPQEVRELLALHGIDTTQCGFSGAPSTSVMTEQKPIQRARATEPSAVESPALVVVAVRALQHGDTIRATDVALQPLAGPLRGLVPVNHLRDVVGLAVTRSVAGGEPLDGRYLQRPILVRRNEAVTVFSRGHGVCVRTTARALDDGARDDLVLVESPESRARYSARVIGRQQAEVFASGTSAALVTPAMRSAAAISHDQQE